MSAISFNIELDPKEKKNGKHEIRIRMSQNRKHKRFNVGFAIEKKLWNAEKQQVRATHPLSTIINAAIQTKLMEVQKEYLQSVPLEQPISIAELQKKAKRDVSGGDFVSYFKERLNTYENGSTRRTLEKVLTKLEAYLKGKELFFTEINHDFLDNYVIHLRRVLGNSDSTIHHNVRTLRAIFNQALVSQRYVPKGISPFFGYKLSKGKSNRSKLNMEEIEKIEAFQPAEGTNLFHARNFFLLSYYLLGMRVSSMIKLKWSNIDGNRCRYQAAKGDKPMDVLIPPKGLEILEFYRNANKRGSEYIFPFLKKGEKIDPSSKEDAQKLESITATINKNLKKMASELGIEKNISSHVARHSFAYTARKRTGNDIYAIQKALGHSSVSVTENYFGSEETIEADGLSKLLFE